MALVVVMLIFPSHIEDLYADSSNVYESILNEPIELVYPMVLEALNNNGFIVAHSINVSENYKRYESEWGGINKYKITEVRSLSVCNLKFSYEIRNKDPKMLGLCPMHLTLYETQGKTHIIMLLPSFMAQNSPVKGLALKVEKKLINIIQAEVLK